MVDKLQRAVVSQLFKEYRNRKQGAVRVLFLQSTFCFARVALMPITLSTPSLALHVYIYFVCSFIISVAYATYDRQLGSHAVCARVGVGVHRDGRQAAACRGLAALQLVPRPEPKSVLRARVCFHAYYLPFISHFYHTCYNWLGSRKVRLRVDNEVHEHRRQVATCRGLAALKRKLQSQIRCAG